MCGMNRSENIIADNRSKVENGNHITSIYIDDTTDRLQNNFVQNGSKTGNLLERNSHEMVEITSLENSFPPPPSSLYLESINLN